MNTIESSVDTQEITKFAQHASDWWDLNGPLKTLHDINQTRLDFILRNASLQEKTVLDVGCGGGILSEALARLGGVVTGIDAALASIEVALAHAKANALNIDYRFTPIEDLEAPAFDVVTCMELLEHVPNPELILQSCSRLVKPGGFVFVSTINRTAKAYLQAIIAAEYVLNLLPRQTHDYKKFIKPSELVAIGRAHALELVDMSGLKYNPISRSSSLCQDVSVNYLLAFKRC